MRSRRSPLPARLGAATLTLAVAATLAPTPASASDAPVAPRDARHADAFVDSVGVNIHLHYTDTAYARFDDIVRPRLRELGVRHLRDVAYTYPEMRRSSFFLQRVRALGEDGRRFTLLTSMTTDRGRETDWSLLPSVVAWTDGAVDALEGPNEPDLDGLPSDVWPERARQAQQRLWQTVRAEPSLRHLDVLGPSPAWSPHLLGDISASVTHGNYHPYPGGRCGGCADLASLLTTHRAPTGDRPMVATETGYHTALGVPASEGHRPVSEAVEAAYLPGLLFEQFDLGVERSFLYELLDMHSDPTRSDRESNFGLVRNDGTPKPSFTTLQRTLAVLADPGPAYRPAPLSMAVDAGDDVRSTLLGVRDGRYVLALRRATSAWDRDASQDVPVARTPVVVRTATPMASRVHEPSREAAPTATSGATDRHEVAVDHHTLLLELIPEATPEPPPPDEPPVTGPPVTGPPVTGPPVTGPPVTEPPVSRPPAGPVRNPGQPRDGAGACPVDRIRSGRFPDVRGGVHAAAIDCLAWWGVTSGDANGRYRPRATVTRGQMASFLVRAVERSGRTLPTPRGRVAPDVPADSPHARAVGQLLEAGVLSGFGDGTFRPNAPVRRDHMARFLVGGFELRTGRDLPAPSRRWAPDTAGSPFAGDIDRVIGAGWATGFPDGTFRGRDPVRRDQMASFLTRWLDHLVTEGGGHLPR